MRYKMINKKEAEGKEVQYAGIYILKLRDSDMQPDCYFVEDDDYSEGYYNGYKKGEADAKREVFDDIEDYSTFIGGNQQMPRDLYIKLKKKHLEGKSE